MEVPMQLIEGILEDSFPNFQYRVNQKEAILGILHTIANSPKKYIILDAPTGVGKSWIGRQVAEVFNKVYESESVFITKTISLQNQYLHDFPEIHKLMAASNYDCHVDYPVPVPPSKKHHAGCKYTKDSHMCEYDEAKTAFKISKLKTLNYAFFLHGIEHYNTDGLLIADEAHNLEESILDVFDTKLVYNDLKELGIGDIHIDSYLPFSEHLVHLTMVEIVATVDFLRAVVGRLESTLKDLEDLLSRETDAKALLKLLESRLKPLEQKLDKVSNLYRRLALLATDDINRWDISFDKEKKEFSLKPVFIPNFLHRAVFGEAKKILFMSATADRVVQSLKLPPSECETFVLPYVFDLANRPFYAITSLPSLSRDHFETSFPKYIEYVDAILSQYPPTTNVIIHSVSYKNAETLKNKSALSSRMFIPTSEQVRNIKEHVGNGRIIVSPSITEGVDLGDGLASVQIFLKVPYPYLGSTWVNKKSDYDEGWYAYKAMLSIIQGSGRGIRSATDKADTFILDPSFKRLLSQVNDLVPQWFKDTIKWV